MTYTDIPPDLHWACRRGMLELDVLLGNFLREAFLRLPEDEQKFFIELLSNNDQDLFMWLTGRTIAPEPDAAMIVGKIREHAQNRH
jgi:antitoxin CptB